METSEKDVASRRNALCSGLEAEKEGCCGQQSSMKAPSAVSYMPTTSTALFSSGEIKKELDYSGAFPRKVALQSRKCPRTRDLALPLLLC